MISNLNTEGTENSGVADIATRLAIANTELTIARMKGKTSEIKPLLGKILLDIARIGKDIKLSETFVDLADQAYKDEKRGADF